VLKRTLALTLLLAAPVAVPVPAHAAGTGIGPVTIAWSDATHAKVRIAWTETTPVANTVTAGSYELGTTTAAQPDQLLVDAATFPKTGAGQSHQVRVAGTDGTEALSVAFDSYVYDPGPDGLTTSFPAYNQLRWTLRPDDSADSTPNDPLDLPSSYTYAVAQGFDPEPDEWSTAMCTATTTVSTALTGVLPNSGRPFDLHITPRNEWGASHGASRDVSTISAVQLTAPAATPYGGTTTLTGHVDQTGLLLSGMPPTCDENRFPAAQTTLIVHQRTSAAAPWTVVGTTKTGDDGNYRAVVRNPGYREYRVVVASGTDPNGTPRFGANSRTVAVRATTRVVSTKLIQPTVALGTQPQADVQRHLHADRSVNAATFRSVGAS
jgi:hypothetical protein